MFTLGALSLGCGAPQTRIAGEVVALPQRDESPREGRSVRRVGVMWSLTGDTATLVEVPAVAQVNEATTVRVEVSGGGCSGPDTTIVSVEGVVATIVPYQKVFTPVPPHGACAEVLVFDIRTVSVTFLTRGPGRIRVVYRQGEGAPLAMTERQIVVQ